VTTALPDLDLLDTESQFRDVSGAELRKIKRLFTVMNCRPLSRAGQRLILWALWLNVKWAETAIRNTFFAHFCSGESLWQAGPRVEALNERHVTTILDYAVESAKDERALDAVRDQLIDTVVHAHQTPGVTSIALKVTGLLDAAILEKRQAGRSLTAQEQMAFGAGVSRLDRICATAASLSIRVFIDAEASWVQATIDELAEQMIERYNTSRAIVFTTTQMYRHDRLTYLQALLARPELADRYIGLKVVRGAYREQEEARAAKCGYASPIQPDKAATDRDFDAAVAVCISNIGRVALCCATHNDESAIKLASLLDEFRIDRAHPHVVVAQLLGMSDNMSFNLAGAGFNAAKYVPYGPVREVIPYLIRRAEENSSITDQCPKELGLIKSEIARRQTLSLQLRRAR